MTALQEEELMEMHEVVAEELRAENVVLRTMVKGLEALIAGGYCAYCGHVDAFEEMPKHIEQCEAHPMAKLRAALCEISTACETKDLRLIAPSQQALDAQRKVIEYAWKTARAAIGAP